MLNWLKDAVFYEIYPQTFCDSNGDGIGDIKGIESKLDYVKSLGCNAIWLNPVFDSPFMDAGYDVRNYYLVAERYGTNDDLKHLFETAHEKGIKILLDLVPGHTSDQCEWFLQSKKADKNEYTNRYTWTDSVWEAPPQYKFICGVTERDGNYLVNFFSSQPALNYGFNNISHPAWQLPPSHPDCLATVEAMKDVMRFWLDMGCDGFRVDMADSLVKNEDGEKPETCKIWRGIRQMLDNEYPEAAIVSEWCNPQVSLNAGFHCDFYLDHDTNGYRILFRDKEQKSGECKAVFGKEGKGDITKFLDEYLDDLKNTKDKGYISFITCNHDTPRMTKMFSPLEAKIAYSFIFMMPGVPFLYYGDEIGMKFIDGLKSKEGGYSRTGTRTPMQWDSSANHGFSSADSKDLYLPVDSSVDAPTVEAQEKDENSILNTLRKVIAIRHANKDLQADGDFEVVYAEKEIYPFIFKRGQFIIAVNPTENEQSAPFEHSGETVFEIGSHTISDGKIVMQPQTIALIKL
ncbi:MAG: alpha-amylase family glycosyl hydrolase [Clostridia bacterium]|nr:alpha-amylase family glycosyl hydrolase [Clostridia bacterium]